MRVFLPCFCCSASNNSETARVSSPPSRQLRSVLADNRLSLDEGLTVEDVALFAGTMQPAVVRFNDLRWREFPIIHALTLPLTGVPEGFAHCKFRP